MMIYYVFCYTVIVILTDDDVYLSQPLREDGCLLIIFMFWYVGSTYWAKGLINYLFVLLSHASKSCICLFMMSVQVAFWDIWKILLRLFMCCCEILKESCNEWQVSTWVNKSQNWVRWRINLYNTEKSEYQSQDTDASRVTNKGNSFQNNKHQGAPNFTLGWKASAHKTDKSATKKAICFYTFSCVF